jgi:hypothetical protein
VTHVNSAGFSWLASRKEVIDELELDGSFDYAQDSSDMLCELIHEKIRSEADGLVAGLSTGRLRRLHYLLVLLHRRHL